MILVGVEDAQHNELGNDTSLSHSTIEHALWDAFLDPGACVNLYCYDVLDRSFDIADLLFQISHCRRTPQASQSQALSIRRKTSYCLECLRRFDQGTFWGFCDEGRGILLALMVGNELCQEAVHGG